MHYRKKPVIVEAFELEGGKTASLPRWILESDAVCFSQDAAGNLIALRIETLEGTMFARSGDWIIWGVKGEIYPCKPDIFAATYEKADAAQNESKAIDDDMETTKEQP